MIGGIVHRGIINFRVGVVGGALGAYGSRLCSERGEPAVQQVVRIEAGLAPPQPPAQVGVLAPRPGVSACYIIDHTTASARFADPAPRGGRGIGDVVWRAPNARR